MPWGLALLWSLGLSLLPLPFAIPFSAHAVVFSALLGRALWWLYQIQLPKSHARVHRYALLDLGLLVANFLASGVLLGATRSSIVDFSAIYVA